MRRLWMLSPVLLLSAVGCVSQAQYDALANRLLAEEAKNRSAIERLTYLDSENIRLRSQMEEMGLKLQERDAILQAYSKRINWGAIEGTMVGSEGELIVEDKLLFKPGSTAILPGGQAVLDQVARAIKAEGVALVRIEGHTDSDPIVKTRKQYKDNFHLSAMRAHAVLRFLQGRGVPGKKLYLAGFGQYKPRDAANKSKNRRVEIRAFKQP